jgi:hypothetical protein
MIIYLCNKYLFNFYVLFDIHLHFKVNINFFFENQMEPPFSEYLVLLKIRVTCLLLIYFLVKLE